MANERSKHPKAAPRMRRNASPTPAFPTTLSKRRESGGKDEARRHIRCVAIYRRERRAKRGPRGRAGGVLGASGGGRRYEASGSGTSVPAPVRRRKWCSWWCWYSSLVSSEGEAFSACRSKLQPQVGTPASPSRWWRQLATPVSSGSSDGGARRRAEYLLRPAMVDAVCGLARKIIGELVLMSLASSPPRRGSAAPEPISCSHSGSKRPPEAAPPAPPEPRALSDFLRMLFLRGSLSIDSADKEPRLLLGPEDVIDRVSGFFPSSEVFFIDLKVFF
jgi:hypothetical protein